MSNNRVFRTSSNNAPLVNCSNIAYGTASQQPGHANGVNMSISSPDVRDMNRILSFSSDANANDIEPVSTPAPIDPGFGTHIQEAKEIIKDWIR